MDDPTNDLWINHQNIQIDQQTQEMLNSPTETPGGISAEDEAFLHLLVDKIEKKEIRLFEPSTLINVAVYEKLGSVEQGKADYDAFNMLATIRSIYRLWQAGQKNTYQIENLVHRIRLTKERLEEIGGDIYII